MQIDDIDIKILKQLQKDGRTTNVALAKEIDISPPPTLKRVKKLEENGVIKGYVALVDPLAIGIGMHTMVEVRLTTHRREATKDFIEAVNKRDEIMECHHVTGDADFLLKIAVTDIQAFEELILHELTDLPHVANLKTMVILSTVKSETAYKLKGVN